MLKGLYGITDSQLLPDDRILRDAVEQALRGGMRLLQYRDKSLDSQKRWHQANMLRSLCHLYGVPFIVNDDVELAAEVKADGVHLGQYDGSIVSARECLGSKALIGISCGGSLERARRSVDLGVDYVAFGRFFPSRTKPDAEQSEPLLLSAAKAELDVPVVAIGGIRPDNGGELLEAGADMLAVVHGLFGATNFLEQAREFSALFAANSQPVAVP